MAKISIRPATPADATHLACFVDMASEGLALRLWEIMRKPAQTLFEVGRSRALREEGSFSYRNAHLAEIDGIVAGGLVGYRIAEVHDRAYRTAGDSNAPAMPAFVEALVELEAMVPGHWYVNILATYAEHRGRGIGKALLSYADGLARASAAKGLALIVASGNAGARRLYEAAGYREKASRPVLDAGVDHGDWLLMTRA
jgi:ribosomal protein S18 acetylase RimI-like enzyme